MSGFQGPPPAPQGSVPSQPGMQPPPGQQQQQQQFQQQPPPPVPTQSYNANSNPNPAGGPAPPPTFFVPQQGPAGGNANVNPNLSGAPPPMAMGNTPVNNNVNNNNVSNVNNPNPNPNPVMMMNNNNNNNMNNNNMAGGPPPPGGAVAPPPNFNKHVAPPPTGAPAPMRASGTTGHGARPQPHAMRPPPPGIQTNANSMPPQQQQQQNMNMNNNNSNMQNNMRGGGNVPASPHGRNLRGMRRPPGSPRIDPSQIPGPASSGENAEPSQEVKKYATRSSKTAPPPSTSAYIVEDDGNASPRYMRLTMNQAPVSSDMLKMMSIPFAAVMQPLADAGPGEDEVPVVDFGDAGPPRCKRCRSYINPYVRFVNGGRKYVCSFCQMPNEVSDEYYCNVDGYGVRRDHAQRPELSKGSVEFKAPKEYVGRAATEPVFLFVIDVSSDAVSSGMLGQVCMTILSSLDDLALEDRTRIGFITYDKTVQFYTVRAGQKRLQAYVMPDLEDPFVPLPDTFLVRATEHRPAIEELLLRLPSLYTNNIVGGCALGTALKVSLETMSDIGGRVMLFQAGFPNTGPGMLQIRDPAAHAQAGSGNKKVSPLYQPQGDFYSNLATEFARAQTSVDLFLFPRKYAEVATLEVLCRRTNGYVFFYQGFRSDLHGAKLHNELSWCLQAVHAYDGLLRVRCSGALNIERYDGNISMANATDVNLPALDARTTLAVHFKYNDKLDENQESCIQCALLYTNAEGERRIRVHNIAIPNSSVLANVYRSVDLDALLAVTTRQLANEIPKTPLAELRNSVMQRCVDSLAVYRQHCAAASSPGQLILPEALKLYPLYALAVQKNLLVRASTNLSVDRRLFQASLFRALSVDGAVRLAHPRLYALHDMPGAAGLPNTFGEATLPTQVSLTAEKLDSRGAYLLEDGNVMAIWIGTQVPVEFLSQVFGVSSAEEIGPHQALPMLDNELNRKINAIAATLSLRSQYFPLIHVVRQGSKREPWFASFLIEDKLGDVVSYVDHLCNLHRAIQHKIAQSR